MVSERLRYEALSVSTLDGFHRLVEDDHVRRYLLDGQVFPREWSQERARESDDLFARRGVGLWLARDKETGEVAVFCGFLEIPSLHPEPQLVYALLERFTDRGLATKMALASIAEARRHGFGTVVAGVDEINAASVRVLEKLGFRKVATHPGSFGRTFRLALEH